MKMIIVRGFALAGLVALSSPAHAAVSLWAWFW
jgi:hypothetical protein